jgi:hypothetical protein
MWFKQYSTCFASVKPSVQTPVLPKKKKKRCVEFLVAPHVFWGGERNWRLS